MTQQTNLLNTTVLVRFQFLAEVELGVPSKKCKNFGICRIYPLGKFKTLGDGASSFVIGKCERKGPIGGVVSVMEDNSVEISFLKHYIKLLNQQEHFSMGKFRVEEDFYFRSEEMPDFNFQIKKGEYPFKIDKALITILFTNKKSS